MKIIHSILLSSSIFLFCMSIQAQNLDWAFNLGGGEDDGARSIVLDKDGNIYMTGSFQETVDFDPGSGTSKLHSKGLTDVYIAKYDSKGNYLWAKNMGGLYWDFGHSITLDSAGNILLTGIYRNNSDFDPGPGVENLNSNGWYNLFVAKYDNDGNYIWAHGFGGALNDVGNDIKTDLEGNVYVAGHFRGVADFDPGPDTFNLSAMGENEIFIAKYNPQGAFLWAHSFGNTKYDSAQKIDVDDVGNVYVTGFFQDWVDFDPGPDTAAMVTSGNQDIFFAKYNTDGEYQWSKSMGWWDGDGSYTMKVDGNGNLFLSGYFGDAGGGVDFDPGEDVAFLSCEGYNDVFVAKYDQNGDYQWAKSIGGTENDNGYTLDIDDKGNVFVGGSFGGTVDFDPAAGEFYLTANGYLDAYLMQLDPNGKFIWATAFGDYGWDQCEEMIIDESGFLVVTGFFEGTCDFNPDTTIYSLTSEGNSDAFLLKYNLPCYTHSEEVSLCSGKEYTLPDGTATSTQDLYSFTYQDSSGCDSIFVISIIIDTIIRVEEAEICEGETYVFPDGTISDTATMHTSYLYSIEGCDSLIYTTLQVHPSYTIYETVSICDGESYTFPDGTTGSTDTLQYSYFISSLGCDSTIITELIIDHINNEVELSVDTLYAVNENASYQWVDCNNENNPIAGQTSQSFVTEQSGNYAVLLTENNCTALSECKSIVLSNLIDDNSGFSFFMFPNPTANQLYLEFNGLMDQIASIELLTVNGRVLEKIRSNGHRELDLSSIESGFYLIAVSLKNGEQIIQKLSVVK